MESQPTQCETTGEEPVQKKGRHRRKQLFNSILHQMEFYFSDSNLNKDRFLSQLIQENPSVELEVFMKFNKIRKLTTNLEDLRKALRNSELVELSEDQNSVRRKKPIVEKANIDDCTVYVEQLAPDATHDWVNSIFSEFGKVVYVSIPRYKHNNAIKGFAFVEYDTEKEAQEALEYFEKIGQKMPATVEPEKLRSICTFEGGNSDKSTASKKEKEHTSEETGKKRKLSENDESSNITKTDLGDNNLTKKAKVGEMTATKTNPDGDDHKKKKKQKKDKKRSYIKDLGLQVLSKKEWKKMRNRYLDLQKSKMKEFKQHLAKVKFNRQNFDDKIKKSNENIDQKSVAEETVEKLEFVKGVIVKITLPEPCEDIKKLKQEIKASASDIKFVDASLSQDVYVRFDNEKSANVFCGQDTEGTKKVLEGDEEKAYWDKILQDRLAKFKKNAKKQRGRDKLLKKANKVMATHIKFDEVGV